MIHLLLFFWRHSHALQSDASTHPCKVSNGAEPCHTLAEVQNGVPLANFVQHPLGVDCQLFLFFFRLLTCCYNPQQITYVPVFGLFFCSFKSALQKHSLLAHPWRLPIVLSYFGHFTLFGTLADGETQLE